MFLYRCSFEVAGTPRRSLSRWSANAIANQARLTAVHTQRLGQSQELVVVGAAGMYEARCRAHFSPFSDEHGSVQLELELEDYLDLREVHAYES